MIHDIYNYPEWNTFKVIVAPLEYKSLSLDPEQTVATPEVRSLSLRDRKCVFTDEKSLKLYSNYSHENCLNECRIEKIVKLCSCIPFFYKNPYCKLFI